METRGRTNHLPQLAYNTLPVALMTQLDSLQRILKDSHYNLTIFSPEEKEALREKVFTKTTRGKHVDCVNCIICDKPIQLKPEEIVRQLYANRLIEQYSYPQKRLAFEHPVNFGREKKKADIIIFDQHRHTDPYIVVELKKPKFKDGKEQLRSYCNATGAPIGVWTNGVAFCIYRLEASVQCGLP